jgi:hypothetical protein
MGVVMFAKADREQLAAAWRAGEHIYTAQRSPLYAALSKAGAEDADILELSSHALGAAPPGEAWPHFRAFCQEHREALTSLLQTRPVQMTYVERCRVLMPAMSLAGQMAGAPMHIVELGCSAGIMLIFDKYAYEMRPGEVVGPADAEIRLKGELHGGAKLEMPQILSRTGIDLNLIDPHSADDRRWMLATCFPELLGEQQRLARAIDLVAETDIRWFEGDALGHVSRVLAETPDPVCLYHSACLMYWSAEAKAELERQLLEASKGRSILRVAVEAGEKFDRWQAGASKPNSDPGTAARATGEIVVTRYRNGEAEGRIVANSTSDYATVYWLD